MSIRLFACNNSRELSAIIAGIKRTGSSHIVIPSRKDKFFLREPNLWTWEDLYNDINRLSRRYVFSPPDHLLILRSILDGVNETYSHKVKAFPGIDKPGFLEVLSSDIRELLNEAVPPETLAANPDSDNPSEFLLPEVYERYITYLNAHSLMDSAQICSALLDALNENQDWGKDYQLILAGFMTFNHSQLELVKALDSRCSEVIIIKPEAHLTRFGDASAQFRNNVRAKPSTGNIVDLNISEPGLEPEMIARTLALWSAGERPDLGEFPGFDAIGLMIGEGREDSFAQAFRRYGVPYDFMSGIPISRTMPGKILSALATLSVKDFPAYDTAMLLSQNCFAGAAFPLIEAYRAGRSGLDAWLKYLAESEEPVFKDALKALTAIKKFCAVMSANNTPRRIINAFNDFLNTPGLWLERKDKTADSPELDEAVRQTASAIETVGQKFLAISELTPDIGPVQDTKLSPRDNASYDFLETWCRNTNTRAPIQTANSVRVFTGRPPVLASFPVWIMTDVTGRTWSGNMPVSPLLDNEERKKLNDMDAHLMLSADKAQQNEALFRRLIHTGSKLTIISRPMLDDKGRPLSESPFMQNFRDDMKGWKIVETPAEGIRILLGGDGFIFPEIDAAEKVRRRSPLIAKRADTVGASDIHELLSCPLLWWQKRQAKIYEQSTELASSAEWGNMLHKYWERVWRTYRSDMEKPGDAFILIAHQEWRKLTAKPSTIEEYDPFHRLVADPRLARKLGTIRFRVERLVKIQAALLDGLHKAGWVHRDILLEENAHLLHKQDGITFLGQCDRIELLDDPNGSRKAFIVDYKTGNGKNYEAKMKTGPYWWRDSERGKDGDFERGLQLSVYAAMFDECALAGVYILGLEDGEISGTIAEGASEIFAPYKSDKFSKDIEARVREGEYAMDSAVKVLERQEFSPEYESDLCQWCKVKSLCRKGEFNGEIIADSEE